MRGLPGKGLNEWQRVQWGDWPNLTTMAMTRLCSHCFSLTDKKHANTDWLIIPLWGHRVSSLFSTLRWWIPLSTFHAQSHTHTHTHTHTQRSPTSIQAFETWNELWLKPAALERRCDEVKRLCFTNSPLLNYDMFLYVFKCCLDCPLKVTEMSFVS